MTVADALQGVTKLAIDTPAFIYFVEANPKYVAVCREVLRHLAAGGAVGATSMITLTEVLVHPIRTADTVLETEYRNLLLSTSGIVTASLDVAIARRAAEVRAQYNLRTPDAIQVATALELGCDAFLTNDADLRRVTEIAVLVIDELTV